MNVDYDVILPCGSCSERYGLCGFHQEKFQVDWRGDPLPDKLTVAMIRECEKQLKAVCEKDKKQTRMERIRAVAEVIL